MCPETTTVFSGSLNPVMSAMTFRDFVSGYLVASIFKLIRIVSPAELTASIIYYRPNRRGCFCLTSIRHPAQKSRVFDGDAGGWDLGDVLPVSHHAGMRSVQREWRNRSDQGGHGPQFRRPRGTGASVLHRLLVRYEFLIVHDDLPRDLRSNRSCRKRT